MSITDELREYARHLHNVWYNPLSNVYTHTTMDIAPSLDALRLDEHVLAIADRIDAEHEATVLYWQNECHKDGYDEGRKDGFDEGFASADDWLAQNEDAMAEHGWIRLPLGEDGEPIRIGELVDERLPFGGYAKPAPVDGMELYRYANGYGWMVKLDAENRALISPKLLRHHHAPTVEDVLREFAEKVIDSQIPDVHPTYEESIAEYAAKLRLAGDAE